jgi:hypothetical protein
MTALSTRLGGFVLYLCSQATPTSGVTQTGQSMARTTILQERIGALEPDSADSSDGKT